MDGFEWAMKAIVVTGVGGLVLLMLGVGVKVLFFRKRPTPTDAVDVEQLDGLEDRLLRTESKVNELEERLDFAERMLTEARAKPKLPGPRVPGS